ncbi:MAG: UvrD-helicase domain-containing protein, partial [bacterium]|nr:UvrD-helicase domain-containing protein [bacterium]
MPSLTKDQQAAVSLLDKNLVLIASAGSGKTSVLVEKVATLLEKTDSRLENILTMTFTEKAAAELKERIQKRLHLGRQEMAQAPIQTLHGFCADLLKEQEGKPLKIMDEHFATAVKARVIHEGLIELLRQELPAATTLVAEFGFRRVREICFTTFDQSYNLREWKKNHLAQKIEEEFSEPLLEIFALLRDRFKEEKNKGDVFDFDDLEERAIHLLETNKEKRDFYQNRFHYILIDEFQDTNPVQIRLLEQLHHPQKNRLFVVGDPKQSIYQFRGADISLFQKMVQKIRKENGEVLYLRDNFRAAPSLIEPINRFFSPHFS